MTDNYRTIERKLANLETFVGNSMSATRYREGHVEIYEVLSYSTVVARHVWYTGKYDEMTETAISKNHWGRTTGRHINLCRRLLPGGAEASELHR